MKSKQTRKVGIGVTWLCRWAENWLKLSCQTRQCSTFPGFWVSKKKKGFSHSLKTTQKSLALQHQFSHQKVTFFKEFHPMCKMWNLIIPFICNSILLFRFSVIRNSSSSQGWTRMKLTTILIFVVLMTSLILACRHDDVYLKFYHPTDLKPMNPISAVIFHWNSFVILHLFCSLQSGDYEEDIPKKNPWFV